MAELANEKGSLREIPPVQLFLRAQESAFTGSLALVRDEEKRVYLFEQGKPISARSNLKNEFLGEILSQGKKITHTQQEKVLQIMASTPGSHFGEVVMSLGLLDGVSLISRTGSDSDLQGAGLEGRGFRVRTENSEKYSKGVAGGTDRVNLFPGSGPPAPGVDRSRTRRSRFLPGLQLRVLF
jgi:hypothetical protein